MKFLEAYNLIDIFVVVVLLITLILGIWKGFLRSLAGLASLVIGVVLAARYYPVVEPYLGRISSLDPQISMILSMVIIFIAVQAVFVVIRRILDALVAATRLGWLDRSFGALIGLAAGFLVVAAVVEALLLGFPEWQMLRDSKLVRPVDQLAKKIVTVAPKSARDQLQSLIEKLKGTSGGPPSKPQSKETSTKRLGCGPDGLPRSS